MLQLLHLFHRKSLTYIVEMFPNSMTHIKMPFTISNKLTCNPHHFTINIYYRLDGQKVDKILASQNITCIWSTLQIENLQSFRNHAKLQNFEFSWDFRRAQELSKQITKSNVSPTAHRLKNIFHQKLNFSISELKRNTKKIEIFFLLNIFLDLDWDALRMRSSNCDRL